MCEIKYTKRGGFTVSGFILAMFSYFKACSDSKSLASMCLRRYMSERLKSFVKVIVQSILVRMSLHVIQRDHGSGAGTQIERVLEL